MNQKLFGSVVAAAVANLLVQGIALADDKAPVKAAGVGHCVHDCSGNAECKGHGNNTCKGKNDCAGQGLVPKACSSQTTVDSCKKVMDDKKNNKCTWLTEK